ncbi:MAG: hypothetical protein E7412_01555 [Ruminococcaceae bacterium]|nr:hypothetical protein [Oscillospiraceae bacterium]
MSNLKFSKKLLADFASDILISDIKAYIAEHAEEFAEFEAAHTDMVEIRKKGEAYNEYITGNVECAVKSKIAS